jgi:hypothetical protein
MTMPIGEVTLTLGAGEAAGPPQPTTALSRLKSAVFVFATATDSINVQGGSTDGKWTNLKAVGGGSSNVQLEGDYAQMRLSRQNPPAAGGSVTAVVMSMPQLTVGPAGPAGPAGAPGATGAQGPPAPVRFALPDEGAEGNTLTVGGAMVGTTGFIVSRLRFAPNLTVTTAADTGALITVQCLDAAGVVLGTVGTFTFAASTTNTAFVQMTGVLGAFLALPAGSMLRAALTKTGAGESIGGGVFEVAP